MNRTHPIEQGEVLITQHRVTDRLMTISFRGRQQNLLNAINRHSIGWGHYAVDMTLDELVEMTGLLKPNVCRGLENLKARHILLIEKLSWQVSRYRINMNFGQWKNKPKSVITSAVDLSPSVISSDPLSGPDLSTSIITSDNLSGPNLSTSVISSDKKVLSQVITLPTDTLYSFKKDINNKSINNGAVDNSGRRFPQRRPKNPHAPRPRVKPQRPSLSAEDIERYRPGYLEHIRNNGLLLDLYRQCQGRVLDQMVLFIDFSRYVQAQSA